LFSFIAPLPNATTFDGSAATRCTSAAISWVIARGVVIHHVTVGTRVQIAVGSYVIRDAAAQTVVSGSPAVAVTQLARQKGHSIAKDNLVS
jgi:acetyltransferase-like isoleucine patch superfamily enzyme